MSIKYQYKPLDESPYASLGKLGSPYRSLNFGNAAQAAPMQPMVPWINGDLLPAVATHPNVLQLSSHSQ